MRIGQRGKMTAATLFMATIFCGTLCAQMLDFIGKRISATFHGASSVPPGNGDGLIFFADQDRAGDPQVEVPVLRTRANLVLLDVVVTNHERPVKGLPPQSFRVLDNGHEQVIKNVEEYDATGLSPQALPIHLPAHTYSNVSRSPVNGTLNVLLLDALNTPAQDQSYVRNEMLKYLDNVPSGTPMAVFTLTSRLRLIQGFTENAAHLRAALNGAKAGPKESVLLTDQNEQEAAQQYATGDTDSAESLRQFLADTSAMQDDLRVQTTVEAMQQLARYLGGIEGRKNLIWLSGSFPLNLDPDLSLRDPFGTQRDFTDRLKETSSLLAASRVAVYPVDVRGVFPPSIFSASSSGSAFTRGAGGRGRGSSASRPHPLATSVSQSGARTTAEHSTMTMIAEQTGGMPFYGTNALQEAATRAIEHGTHYYTLSYAPTQLDNKFHRIEVKLSDNDYHLAYRHTYFARKNSPRKITDSNALINPNSGPLQRGAPPSSQIVFSARILPAGDPELKSLNPSGGPAGLMADQFHGRATRYFINYSIDLKTISIDKASDDRHIDLELVAIAYNADGRVLNVSDNPIKLSWHASDDKALLQHGLPTRQEIDIPAGEVYLRLGVYDLANQYLGTMEVPLKVALASSPAPLHR